MLHVTNGDSAAAKLRAVVGDAVLPWRDVLHDGPVGPPAVRAAHLARRFGADEAAVREEMEARNAALIDAERVTVWFEHDLYDQLQLLEVLSLRADVDAVVAGEYLGELGVAGLAALEPVRVGAGEVAAARAAWAAFTGPDPRAWAGHGGEGVLRFLPAAFRRLGEELPWTTDGLTRSQRQLREAGGDFVASQRTEEARFLGDTLAALLADAPSAWLGGTRTADWRWDPARREPVPA